MKTTTNINQRINVLFNFYKSLESTYTKDDLLLLKMLIKSFSKNELKIVIGYLLAAKIKNNRVLFALIYKSTSIVDNFINEIITYNSEILQKYNFENIHTEVNTFECQLNEYNNLVNLLITNKLNEVLIIDCNKKFYTAKNFHLIIKHLLK